MIHKRVARSRADLDALPRDTVLMATDAYGTWWSYVKYNNNDYDSGERCYYGDQVERSLPLWVIFNPDEDTLEG